jgi:hypothetical protein
VASNARGVRLNASLTCENEEDRISLSKKLNTRDSTTGKLSIRELLKRSNDLDIEGYKES